VIRASYHLPPNASRRIVRHPALAGIAVRIAHASIDKSSVLTPLPMQIMKGLNQVNVWGYIRDNQ
jgi:hypothetical protein